MFYIVFCLILGSQGIFHDECAFMYVWRVSREVILMECFDKAESIDDFKQRLNSLSEKLNKTDKNKGQTSNVTVTVT